MFSFLRTGRKQVGATGLEGAASVVTGRSAASRGVRSVMSAGTGATALTSTSRSFTVLDEENRQKMKARCPGQFEVRDFFETSSADDTAAKGLFTLLPKYAKIFQQAQADFASSRFGKCPDLLAMTFGRPVPLPLEIGWMDEKEFAVAVEEPLTTFDTDNIDLIVNGQIRSLHIPDIKPEPFVVAGVTLTPTVVVVPTRGDYIPAKIADVVDARRKLEGRKLSSISFVINGDIQPTKIEARIPAETRTRASARAVMPAVYAMTGLIDDAIGIVNKMLPRLLNAVYTGLPEPFFSDGHGPGMVFRSIRAFDDSIKPYLRTLAEDTKTVYRVCPMKEVLDKLRQTLAVRPQPNGMPAHDAIPVFRIHVQSNKKYPCTDKSCPGWALARRLAKFRAAVRAADPSAVNHPTDGKDLNSAVQRIVRASKQSMTVGGPDYQACVGEESTKAEVLSLIQAHAAETLRRRAAKPIPSLATLPRLPRSGDAIPAIVDIIVRTAVTGRVRVTKPGATPVSDELINATVTAQLADFARDSFLVRVFAHVPSPPTTAIVAYMRAVEDLHAAILAFQSSVPSVYTSLCGDLTVNMALFTPILHTFFTSLANVHAMLMKTRTSLLELKSSISRIMNGGLLKLLLPPMEQLDRLRLSNERAGLDAFCRRTSGQTFCPLEYVQVVGGERTEKRLKAPGQHACWEEEIGEDFETAGAIVCTHPKCKQPNAMADYLAKTPCEKCKHLDGFHLATRLEMYFCADCNKLFGTEEDFKDEAGEWLVDEYGQNILERQVGHHAERSQWIHEESGTWVTHKNYVTKRANYIACNFCTHPVSAPVTVMEQCAFCKGEDFTITVHDKKASDTACFKCGVVLYAKQLNDTGEDKRTFNNDPSGTDNRSHGRESDPRMLMPLGTKLMGGAGCSKAQLDRLVQTHHAADKTYRSEETGTTADEQTTTDYHRMMQQRGVLSFLDNLADAGLVSKDEKDRVFDQFNTIRTKEKVHSLPALVAGLAAMAATRTHKEMLKTAKIFVLCECGAKLRGPQVRSHPLFDCTLPAAVAARKKRKEDENKAAKKRQRLRNAISMLDLGVDVKRKMKKRRCV